MVVVHIDFRSSQSFTERGVVLARGSSREDCIARVSVALQLTSYLCIVSLGPSGTHGPALALILVAKSHCSFFSSILIGMIQLRSLLSSKRSNNWLRFASASGADTRFRGYRYGRSEARTPVGEETQILGPGSLAGRRDALKTPEHLEESGQNLSTEPWLECVKVWWVTREQPH